MPQLNPAPRQVRLLRDNHGQVIHIRLEFELPGDEATISRNGERLIIEPARGKGLAALLDRWEPLDEDFPEIDDPPPEPKEIF